MAHEILGERFWNRSRELAWHKLGIHGEDASAVAALKRIGEPIVTLEPIYAEIGKKKKRVKIDQRAIMRHPVPEDDEYVAFGIVGPEYKLISAGQLAVICDEHVAQTVETLGFIKRGSIFFATFALPAIDVKGDPVEMYLGAVAPMNGVDAASVQKWALRVVCANTFSWAQSTAIEQFRVVHDDTALERMGSWMSEMYEMAKLDVKVVKQALELLADAPATKSNAKKVIEVAYPSPRALKQNAPQDVMRVRAERHDTLNEYVKKRRAAALELFDGRGTGMAHKSCAGTFYGVVQAVVELENNRRGFSELSVAESNLIGDRAETKKRALNSALAFVA